MNVKRPMKQTILCSDITHTHTHILHIKYCVGEFFIIYFIKLLTDCLLCDNNFYCVSNLHERRSLSQAIISSWELLGYRRTCKANLLMKKSYWYTSATAQIIHNNYVFSVSPPLIFIPLAHAYGCMHVIKLSAYVIQLARGIATSR